MNYGLQLYSVRDLAKEHYEEALRRVAEMGYKTMLAEGAKHVLGWKSPNFVYANSINQKMRLLLRNLSPRQPKAICTRQDFVRTFWRKAHVLTASCANMHMG